MKQLLTAKLKLHTDAEQFTALRQTQFAFRDALNAVSRYAFDHGKLSNQQALQRETYAELEQPTTCQHKWPVMSLGRQEPHTKPCG